MLSKIAARNILGRRLLPTAQRCFSDAAAVAVQSEDREEPNIQTLWHYSAVQLAKQAAKNEGEASYLAELKEQNVDRAAFKPVVVNENDHGTLKTIKAKINAIVEHELKKVDFKAHIDSEDLAADTYAEVITRKNFFFAIDENKVRKNMRVANIKAPGNPLTRPNVILPHEFVPSHNHMSVSDLDQDKLTDMYAYYAYMIDMHIAQIRPENLDEKSYIPARLNQHAHAEENINLHLNNQFFEFYHRWREPTRKWFSQTQEINHQEYMDNRPTTTHYDHDRGDKYEVDWADEQKFPHVADRLGFPMLREEPIEKIAGLERSPAHPGYQFQPFVQTPSMDPDPTLNFEKGETIYENRGVIEWTRFWKALTLSTFGLAPGFYVFEMYAADGLPSLGWISSNWNWFNVPRQFQDGGGWDLQSYRYCDDHDYMNMQYGGKRSLARPCHTMYVVQTLMLLQHMNFDYVSRMVYNKDKDLVFVYKPTALWHESEYVYEMHHLEQMVPFAVTAIKNMSMQRDDGIVTVYDMNTRDNLKFYGADKYWNMDLKDEFMGQTRNLWLQNFSSKRNGSIFKLSEKPSEDMAIMGAKVDRELKAAIAKHGTTTRPSLFEDEFRERVQARKRDIVQAL